MDRTVDMADDDTRLIYVSGECEIDLARRELRVLGSAVPVGGRAFGIVEALARAGGRLVTKNELMDRIWPGAIVMDATLHVHAAAVRKALGPYRDLLKTDSRRGYRLLGDWTVHRLDAATPALASQQMLVARQAPATNLPPPATRLIGRSAAVRRLLDLISAYPLVTLTGSGGIGKTTLALEAARRVVGEFTDGGCLVELASLSDPELVPSAVAGALGLSLGPDVNSAEAIVRAIGAKQLLLVLDNCEHVIDAAASLAEMVVRHCPRATILATSRELFRIEGECAYRVSPLEVPPIEQVGPGQILGHSAAELFIARARELSSKCPALPQNLTAIAAICRRLDGIPLAIEFAAARAATLGIEQIEAGLRDRFALLTSGRRSTLPRHRTLRAVFDWSYQLLPAAEQLLFRWLSVFPSGFSLTAAIEILADRQTRSSIIDGVSGLVEKSLLNVDETAAAVVYRMLETTRDYAYGKLAESGEAHTAMRRHAVHVRNTILRVPPEAGAGDVAAASLHGAAVLRTEEIHNVRAALDWCLSADGDVGIGLEITAAYARTWLHMSLMTECRARMEAALGHLDQASHLTSDLIMQVYVALSIAVIHTTGLVEDTQALLRKVIEIADSTPDDRIRLRALWAIWDYHSNSREYTTALQTARKFHEQADRLGDRSAVVVANRLLGHSLHYHGEQAAARHHLEQVLQLDIGRRRDRTVWFQYDQRVLAGAILARVFWLLGYPDKAAAAMEACCAEATELRHRLSQCYVHALTAFPLACLTGNVAAAQQALDVCAQVASESHLVFYQNWSQCLRGILLIEQKDFSAGTAVMSDTLPILGRVGARQPEFQIAFAKGLAGTGDLTRALDVLRTAVAQAESDGEYWCLPELMRIWSEIVIAQDHHGGDSAERQLRRALHLARAQGARSWELRTAISLAKYLKSRGGRQHESRTILGSVFEQFTEGFATADVKAAANLLASLQ
jgi:predicted ATPase/DNA-binding winged helix-turn-helix (wHTH) protein